MNHAIDSSEKGEKGQTPSGQPMGRLGVFLFGIYFVLLSLLILYVLISIWPLVFSAQHVEAPPTASSPRLFGYIPLNRLNPEVGLFLVVVLAAALGSYVHSATSFATYVGNRQIIKSWSWWYVLRPFIGVALAVLVYFAIRGGLFLTSGDAANINPFGIAAISGLVGMFSKEASDKLHELFGTLFKTTKEIPRADKLQGEQPEVHKDA